MKEAGTIVDRVVDSLAHRRVGTEAGTRERRDVRRPYHSGVPVGTYHLPQPALCTATTAASPHLTSVQSENQI